MYSANIHFFQNYNTFFTTFSKIYRQFLQLFFKNTLAQGRNLWPLMQSFLTVCSLYQMFLWNLQNMTKLWPNLGYKRRRVLYFRSFWVTYKTLWCPEQDLNLHSFRNTHLKRARLPIPPPGLVGFQSLGIWLWDAFWLSSALSLFWCPGQDLNLHAWIGTTPSK